MPGQERYLMLKSTELSANVLNHTWLRFGPVVNYRFGRDDDVDDDVVKEMEEIDGTMEAGAFLGAEFVNSKSPRERFSASVQFLSDVGGEYNGYIVDVSARYWYPVSLPVDISIGVGGNYANSNYMDTYFGVNQKDSDRTGMSLFDAGSGMKGVRVLPAVVVHFSESWHLGIGGRYERLLNDAKNSPLVDDQGSADQWVAGLGVAYYW
jgi:outer membrane protein